jgi:flagellin-like protein
MGVYKKFKSTGRKGMVGADLQSMDARMELGPVLYSRRGKYMRMLRWFNKQSKKEDKKGISPVTGALIMISITIAVSILVYAWSTGFVSEKTAESVRAAEAEYLILEWQSLSGGSLDLAVRNSSNMDIVIDSLYIDGELRSTDLDWAISREDVAYITVPSGFGVLPGDEILLVTERGTRLTFIVL